MIACFLEMFGTKNEALVYLILGKKPVVLVAKRSRYDIFSFNATSRLPLF